MNKKRKKKNKQTINIEILDLMGLHNFPAIEFSKYIIFTIRYERIYLAICLAPSTEKVIQFCT